MSITILTESYAFIFRYFYFLVSIKHCCISGIIGIIDNTDETIVKCGYTINSYLAHTNPIRYRNYYNFELYENMEHRS